MSYLELIVKVNLPAVEIASDFLISEIGFSAVITEEEYVHLENTFGIIKAYCEEGDLCISGENPISPLCNGRPDEGEQMHSNVELAGFCDTGRDGKIEFNAAEIQQKLFEKRDSLLECGFSNEDLGDWICVFTLVEDESWADNWKKYWDVQKIGEKTVICPSWIEYAPNSDEIKIELDPGSAFGTGTHPTTRLCIRELEKYVNLDSTVADIGCGSGILAIAAKKLGASRVDGVDIDLDSIRVSNENAQINSVECNFWQGTACDVKEHYDVVVANILAHVIVEIMPDLKKIAKNGGILIFSGIIEEKAQDVLNSMKKHDIDFVSQEIELGNGENWVCIVGKNNA